ncbi:hypothetical protein QB607_003171 [Clostridium botulinum]|nr:hypothetical protein [Clostridium botulinum]EKS4395844.1 hypothetical protein [Clostridium botulinum]
MKRYVVSIADFHTSENKINIVEAENSIQAICNATGDSIEEFEGFCLKDILELYLKGNILISEPVEI